MTGPDYPMLTIPGYDLYQAAVLATFVIDGLARHRRALDHGGRSDARDATRDVHAGRLALAHVTGNPDLATGPLPRPLDTATYATAQELLAQKGTRRIQVVSLAPAGRTTWAVVGHIPDIGAVGAEVSDPHLAEGLRRHLLLAPSNELTGWAVTPTSVEHTSVALDLGTALGTADAISLIASLDPGNGEHRYAAEALRGRSGELDRVISARFPPLPPPTSTAVQSGSSTAALAGFPAAANALTPTRASADVRQGAPLSGGRSAELPPLPSTPHVRTRTDQAL